MLELCNGVFAWKEREKKLHADSPLGMHASTHTLVCYAELQSNTYVCVLCVVSTAGNWWAMYKRTHAHMTKFTWNFRMRAINAHTIATITRFGYSVLFSTTHSPSLPFHITLPAFRFREHLSENRSVVHMCGELFHFVCVVRIHFTWTHWNVSRKMQHRTSLGSTKHIVQKSSASYFSQPIAIHFCTNRLWTEKLKSVKRHIETR